MDTMSFTKCVGQQDGQKKWGEAGYAKYLATNRYHKPGSTSVYVGFPYEMPLPCHTAGVGSTGEPKAILTEGLSVEDSVSQWTEIIEQYGDKANKALFNGLKLWIAGEAVPDSTQRKITDADKGWWCMTNKTVEELSGLTPAQILALYDTEHAA